MAGRAELTAPDWSQIVLAKGEVLILTSVRPLPLPEFDNILSSVPEWLRDRVVFVDGTTFETSKHSLGAHTDGSPCVRSGTGCNTRGCPTR